MSDVKEEVIKFNKATTNSTDYVNVFEETLPNFAKKATIKGFAISPDTVGQTYARYRIYINGSLKMEDAQLDVDWQLDLFEEGLDTDNESIIKLDHKTTDGAQTIGTTYSYRIQLK